MMPFQEKWCQVLSQLAQLRDYDNNQVVFGAQHHHYVFHPRATASEIANTEKRLGCTFPQELHYVYGEIGNGGVGPDWGLLRLDELEAISGESAGLAGANHFIGLVARYYNYYDAMQCEGLQQGQLFALEEEAFCYYTAPDLATLYQLWLAPELSHFAQLHEAILAGCSITDIAQNYTRQNRTGPEKILRYAASLLGWNEFARAEMHTQDYAYRWLDLQTYVIKDFMRDLFQEKLLSYRQRHAQL